MNARAEFDRLVALHRPAIYGHALRLTRDPDAAEDLAQASLVRAARGFDRFDGENFRAWALTIVTRLHLNDLKKAERSPRRHEADPDECADGVSAMRAEFAEYLPPEVMEAIRELPDPFVRTFVLKVVVGMSQDEVAAAEGIPVGTVRSRVSRARAFLAERLGDYAREEWGVGSAADEGGG